MIAKTDPESRQLDRGGLKQVDRHDHPATEGFFARK